MIDVFVIVRSACGLRQVSVATDLVTISPSLFCYTVRGHGCSVTFESQGRRPDVRNKILPPLQISSCPSRPRSL